MNYQSFVLTFVALIAMIWVGLKLRLPLISIAILCGFLAVFVWLSDRALNSPTSGLSWTLFGIASGAVIAHLVRPTYLKARRPRAHFIHYR